MKRSKELAVCGMLTALAIILSIVERMFPLDAIIPIPGVKLGLANVVTLFALTRLGLRDSLAVVVVRVTLASLLMGSVTAFLFSLFGGLLALFVMWALLHAEGKFCSLLGVSVAGAAAHNIGQIAAAVLWMKTTAVLAYLPYLLLMSVPLGLVTGLVCAVVLTHMKKISFFLPHYHKNRGGKRYENAIDTAHRAAVRLRPFRLRQQRSGHAEQGHAAESDRQQCRHQLCRHGHERSA